MKTSNTTGRHRRDGLSKLLAHPHDFRPKHCAGTSCMHDHADGSLPPATFWRNERVS